MRLATIPQPHDEPIAVLERDGVWYNFSEALDTAASLETSFEVTGDINLETFIKEGWLGSSHWEGLIELLDEENLLAPSTLPYEPTSFCLPFRPGKIICMGHNYAAHAKETGHTPPTEPIFFQKASSSCIGHESPIYYLDWFRQVDPEVELAVIIGHWCEGLNVDNAMSFVGGYTIFNDFTERWIQREDMANRHPWFRSKSINRFGPMGPWIVRPESMPDPLELDIELRVNGETRQKSNTRELIFKIPEMLAAITRYMSLEPGDVISTGTPEGIAPVFPGDIVEAEIQGIGILRNPVEP